MIGQKHFLVKGKGLDGDARLQNRFCHAHRRLPRSPVVGYPAHAFTTGGLIAPAAPARMTLAGKKMVHRRNIENAILQDGIEPNQDDFAS
jgi:hypothetical protein